MQGALSTTMQAAPGSTNRRRRKSGCLPGQCKTDRMEALARTRLQALVVAASSKLTLALVQVVDLTAGLSE
ncbi:hypothetical protein V8C42DRAFT_308995 [Trichoderma barbatum]